MGLFGELTSRAVSAGAVPEKSKTDKTDFEESGSTGVSSPFNREISKDKALKQAFARKDAMFKLNKVFNDLPEGSTKDYGLG